MIYEFSIKSAKRTQLCDITSDVQSAVSQSGAKDGLLTVYRPHTTAAITINENADPAVQSDMAYAVDKLVPWSDPQYRHMEGNTAAHMKSSLFGCSEHMIIKGGAPLLGTW